MYWNFGTNLCKGFVCGTPTRYETPKSEKVLPWKQLLMVTPQNLINSISFSGKMSWKFDVNHYFGFGCKTPTRPMPAIADTANRTEQAMPITPALDIGVKKLVLSNRQVSSWYFKYGYKHQKRVLNCFRSGFLGKMWFVSRINVAEGLPWKYVIFYTF